MRIGIKVARLGEDERYLAIDDHFETSSVGDAIVAPAIGAAAALKDG